MLERAEAVTEAAPASRRGSRARGVGGARRARPSPHARHDRLASTIPSWFSAMAASAGGEIRAPGRELRLCARECLLRLVKGGEMFLDMRIGELLRLRPRGGRGRSSILSSALSRASSSRSRWVQLLRVGREPSLRMFQRLVVGRGARRAVPTATAPSASSTFALLDRRDALRELPVEPSQLLLGSDPDRVQALLLALDGERFRPSSSEQRHASMICAARPFSCLAYAARSSSSSARARRTISALKRRRASRFEGSDSPLRRASSTSGLARTYRGLRRGATAPGASRAARSRYVAGSVSQSEKCCRRRCHSRLQGSQNASVVAQFAASAPRRMNPSSGRARARR